MRIIIKNRGNRKRNFILKYTSIIIIIFKFVFTLVMDDMVMKEDVYFDFDKSNLKPAAQESLLQKADWLRENSDVTVTIEGHCDERGTNEYNLALGDRRAESMKAFLVNLGISASRLTTISYGEERPVCFDSDEECWAKNRRGHFTLN